MQHQHSALVVLSGGQDSTTCLLWAMANYAEVHAISFNYGQRHSIELHAASLVGKMAGVKTHRIVDIMGVMRSSSPLISSTPLETYQNYEQMDKVIGNRIEKTFVPLRNLLFLNIAVNHALAIDCYDVVTGVCASDNANYPDCTADFISSAEYVINEALGNHRLISDSSRMVAIHAPLLELDKAGIVKMATQYEGWEAMLSESHTCYDGQVPPCGKCHACVLRAEGFKQAGVADPLITKWQGA